MAFASNIFVRVYSPSPTLPDANAKLSNYSQGAICIVLVLSTSQFCIIWRLFYYRSLLKVFPAKKISFETTERLILANDSLLNEAIKSGDLSKTAEIANSVLQAISQDTAFDARRKMEVKICFHLPEVCTDVTCRPARASDHQNLA